MGAANVRQLAAVMFTDIAGYTATMQENEIKANKQRERHRLILQKRADEFGGKIVNFFGDGAISIYGSAINAVKSAIKVQQDLKTPFLPLRIGLHMGDIVCNEFGEVYGDAVNIASRLEGLSVAGGILLSGKMKEELKNNDKINTIPLGSHQLKNVKHPLNIYAVGNRGLRVPSYIEIKAKTGRSPMRLMVLPFLTLSNKRGFEYFSDGLSEELISVLSGIPSIEVSSRTTAFTFKKRNDDVLNIGKKFSVSHVLEGSVRKNSDKIRVTAQLIETEGGFHIWSETFDHHLKDIFYLQDLISKQIAGKVKKSLHPEWDEQETTSGAKILYFGKQYRKHP